MEYKLIKYRGEEKEYVYFWTELQGEVDVHISPMFHSTQEAVEWMHKIRCTVIDICNKMKEG